MKKAIFLSLLFLINLSCSQEQNKKNEAIVIQTKKQAVISKGSKETVDKFYHWYIDSIYIPSTDNSLPDYYTPEIKEIGQGFYKLDTTAYFKLLRKQSLFSEDFIKNEWQIITSCNSALKNVKLTEEAEVVYDVEPCSFLSYNRWVGGQGEDIRRFKILQVKETGNTSEALISTFDGEIAKVKLVLSEQNRQWKIDRIIHPL